MLRYSVSFLAIAIIAAIFAFGGVTTGSTLLAKNVFYIFLLLFVLSGLLGALMFKKHSVARKNF